MDNRLKVGRERRQEMIEAIKGYFLTEKDEEIGDLGASLLLDFFIQELAADFYNQGVNDSYTMLSDKLEDLFGLQIRRSRWTGH